MSEEVIDCSIKGVTNNLKLANSSSKSLKRDELTNLEDDEDEVAQNWTHAAKLSGKSVMSSIPKRGEKDYEPDGTNVQELLLYRARKAMFDTLENSPRGSVISSQVKAYYDPTLHKAMLPQPKGNFMQTMGSVDSQGRCWLPFHEFIYLAERGTVSPFYQISDPDLGDQGSEVPLSMQDLYSLFKDQEEMDRYFVFAHLKRLGFIVTLSDERVGETTSFDLPREATPSWHVRIKCDNMFSFLRAGMTSLWNAFFYGRWNFLLRRYTSFTQIYQGASKLIPSYSPPKSARELTFEKLYYQSKSTRPAFPLAFDVWKPQTKFRKRNPGLPDVQVVIYNKNDASRPFPSYSDMQETFRCLDYRFDYISQVDGKLSQNGHRHALRSDNVTKLKSSGSAVQQPGSNETKRKPNAKHIPPHVKQMHRLKDGYRYFLLAIIDDGLISFVKISEADFGSEDVWFVPPKQDKLAGKRSNKN